MSFSKEVYDVVIIGGGLSGLTVAHSLQNNPRMRLRNNSTKASKWKLLEATSSLGGRLKNDDSGHKIDLGGAWIWRRFQPHVSALVSHLGLQTFQQPQDPESTRFEGGAVQLIHGLASKLPTENILLDAPVKSIKRISADSKSPPMIQIETSGNNDDDEKIFVAKQVVLAVAPKLVEKHIAFDPPVSAKKQRALRSCPTWMASVTKVSLVYDKPFWKEGNQRLKLHRGKPAFQVYDASTRDGSVSALTFFTLAPTPPAALSHHKATRDNNNNLPREKYDAEDQLLARTCAEQLAWIPEQQGEEYVDYHVQRWPLEMYISEDEDPKKIHPHPHPIPALATPEYDGALLWAGSETDQESPGLMEGAIGAAERVINQIENYYR